MSKETFMKRCNELLPYIENKVTKFRKTISVESQIVAKLHHLADDANSFGIGKSTLSKIVRRLTQAI